MSDIKKNNLIDGRAMSEEVKDSVVKEIEELCSASKMTGRRPNLAIVLVGNREDSEIYVGLKEREAKKVGIDTHLYRCEENIEEREIFDMIRYLNNDPEIDAILVQLPLPDGFDTDGIIASINPNKDADCFHPDNLKRLVENNEKVLISPVYATVKMMLEETGEKLAGKTAIFIGNSDIFSLGMVHILKSLGMVAGSIKSDSADLKKATSEADVIVTAVGMPRIIKKEMVKEGAIIIDIGISKEKGKVVGDVDFEEVKDIISHITPVPGGVGPMTIAMLFKNVVELYRRRAR